MEEDALSAIDLETAPMDTDALRFDVAAEEFRGSPSIGRLLASSTRTRSTILGRQDATELSRLVQLWSSS